MKQEKLPEVFMDKMKDLLDGDYQAYLDSFEKPAFSGIRINNLKLTPAEFLKLSPWCLKKVPWISNGFYYNADGGDDKPARHPFYYAGLYYLQEPSAMTPASLLPIRPGDCVLDLCAAPGGKSTELAAALQGEGLLLSNDISNSRAKALLKNLELCGAGNILVTSETPEKLAQYFEGFFDKILVDAPCSGEGMFRRDKDMVKSWQEKGPAYYSGIQKTIISEALQMLKPGGLLLYSTCTFDEEEDEGVIRFALEKQKDLSLVPLEKKEGFSSGIGLSECVRLFPHNIDGEGHFMALLKKAEADNQTGYTSANTGEKGKLTQAQRPAKADMEAVFQFLGRIEKEFDESSFYIKNESVYYLPKPLLRGDLNRLLKLRYLRTGLLIGEIKKGRFEPSQALAMSLSGRDFANTLYLSVEDERVIRYLKGETLALTEAEQDMTDGWCLVCVEHFPLGFAKKGNGSLKNKYYPGWRWQ